MDYVCLAVVVSGQCLLYEGFFCGGEKNLDLTDNNNLLLLSRALV